MSYRNHVRRISTSLKLAVSSHYDALGINPRATQAEVKSAYYKLSKVYHPDKNQGSTDAATKFRDITAAYEVLGNVRLRRLYDKGIDINRNAQTHQQTYEDEDPSLKFYRSREFRSRPPMGTGRTPFYDFDEWSRAHYGTTFARDMNRKRANESQKDEGTRFREQHKIETVTYLTFFVLVMLMLAVNEGSYDRPAYVKPTGQNSTGEPPPPLQ